MSRGFNWEMAIDRSLATKIRRAVVMAKGQINSDYDKNHAAEVREFATNGRHTELLKRIKEEHKKEVQQALERRNKIGAGKR